MMNEYLKLCKDCAYHERVKVHHKCNVLAHPERYDPVTGEQTGQGMGKIDCIDMRMGPCGLDGLFYAKKD